MFNSHHEVTARSLKNYNKEIFNQKVSDADWSDVLVANSVDDAWYAFKIKFLNILDSVVPFKKIRIKQRTELWMTNEILHLIHERDTALHQFHLTDEEQWYKRFIYFRNKVQFEVKNAKANFYANKIEENKDQPKKIWQVLKKLGASAKTKNGPANICLKINDEMTFDNEKVANTFNNFFTGIAATLVEKLPTGKGLFGRQHVDSFYKEKDVTPDSFKLQKVDVDSVVKSINEIGASKATGLDGIPAKFIKDGVDS